MGMFDYIVCEYPLPGVEHPEQYEWQTKDTPRQFLDYYRIDAEGQLWHEEYDIEDKSPATAWINEHPGEPLPKELEGLMGLAGACTRVNVRWEPEPLTCSICFYSDAGEFTAFFRKGLLFHLEKEEEEV